jgi:hypothetical protein
MSNAYKDSVQACASDAGTARTVDELKRMIESSPPLTGKTEKTITAGSASKDVTLASTTEIST